MDFIHPTEDGIFNSGDFESFPWEKVQVSGKTGNLSHDVHIECFKNESIVVSDKRFLKMYLKYFADKYPENNLPGGL